MGTIVVEHIESPLQQKRAAGGALNTEMADRQLRAAERWLKARRISGTEYKKVEEELVRRVKEGLRTD